MREYTHSVYILLTRTSSILSRLIRALTRAAYTHAALSLDDEFEETYSFTRRNPRLVWPAGLARENLWRGLYLSRRDPPCRVYRVRLTEEEYLRIQQRVRAMYADRQHYHYNYIGVAANYFGQQHSSPRRYFCSEFVATMVSIGQDRAALCPARTRPMDLTKVPEFECVFEGTVGDLRNYIENCRDFRMMIWEEGEKPYPLIVSIKEEQNERGL